MFQSHVQCVSLIYSEYCGVCKSKLKHKHRGKGCGGMMVCVGGGGVGGGVPSGGNKFGLDVMSN